MPKSLSSGTTRRVTQLAKKLHIAVPKSKDAKYGVTASNKERRAARRARRLQKDALTFTSRGRHARRRARFGSLNVGEPDAQE